MVRKLSQKSSFKIYTSKIELFCSSEYTRSAELTKMVEANFCGTADSCSETQLPCHGEYSLSFPILNPLANFHSREGIHAEKHLY